MNANGWRMSMGQNGQTEFRSTYPMKFSDVWNITQHTKLLEVQEQGLHNGYGKEGFAYFMEMGLGKTLTALTEFNLLVRNSYATRLVVVCPNSFKTGWVDEIQKHRFDFHPHVFQAGNGIGNAQFANMEYDKPPVLIVNYEAIRSEAVQAYIRRFVEGRNCMVAFDESIQIKTYNSLQTKAALKMAPWFKFKRLLSGKPMTSGPHDLWAQMRAIGAIHDNYFPFKTTFCKMGGFKGKKVVGAQNEEILAQKIGKYIFKATKANWTDLPPKLYTSREYKLTPAVARQYKEMEDEFVMWLQSGESVSVDTFITKYIKLAQIQSGFIIKENDEIEELVPPDENPRFLAVKEIVDGLEGKAVVPYFHRYTLGILQRTLIEYNPAHISGGMKPEDIQAQKDRFNGDVECRVIFVQIRAGKYGHTLLGGSDVIDSCSTMIFAENSYSLDDRSQIEDRIHRHGQTRSCLYIDLWGTELDRRITKALQAKESIVSAVMHQFQSPK